MRKTSGGFTLLELIAVIAILTALTVLLLPAIQQSRAAARRSNCQSNLHQWALAVQHYAAGHGGALPIRGQGIQPTQKFDKPYDWFNALPPFMEHEPLMNVKDVLPFRGGDRSVWMCPEMQDSGKPIYFSYGMNMRLSPTKGKQCDYINKVGPTTTMVFMTEGIGTQCSLLPAPMPYSPVARHQEFINIAFLDGHVTAYSGEYVGCGIGDPQRRDIRWIVPESDWTPPST